MVLPELCAMVALLGKAGGDGGMGGPGDSCGRCFWNVSVGKHKVLVWVDHASPKLDGCEFPLFHCRLLPGRCGRGSGSRWPYGHSRLWKRSEARPWLSLWLSWVSVSGDSVPPMWPLGFCCSLCPGRTPCLPLSPAPAPPSDPGPPGSLSGHPPGWAQDAPGL